MRKKAILLKRTCYPRLEQKESVPMEGKVAFGKWKWDIDYPCPDKKTCCGYKPSTKICNSKGIPVGIKTGKTYIVW